jgi:hypothetical protein
LYVCWSGRAGGDEEYVEEEEEEEACVGNGKYWGFLKIII